MDDREARSEPEVAERMRRLLEGGRHRWHAAPGDGLLFVLDDGTGDVELRVQPTEAGIAAILVRLDQEVERFAVSCTAGDAEDEAFRARLDEAVETLQRATVLWAEQPLQPWKVSGYGYLGDALRAAGRHAEAEAEHRTELRLRFELEPGQHIIAYASAPTMRPKPGIWARVSPSES